MFTFKCDQPPLDLTGKAVYAERKGGVTVYKTTDARTHELFAVKHIRNRGFTVEQLSAELALLEYIVHMQNMDNVGPDVHTASLVAATIDQSALVLVFAWMQMSLEQTQQSTEHRLATARSVLDVSIQLLDAVAFLHTIGITHCDIAAKNIMWNRYGRVTIIDVGNSCIQHRDVAEIGPQTAIRRTKINIKEAWNECNSAGTPRTTICYRSPELLLSWPLDYYEEAEENEKLATFSTFQKDPACDVWALGCVICNLFMQVYDCKFVLFPIYHERQLFLRQCTLIGVPSETLWPGVDRLANFELWLTEPKQKKTRMPKRQKLAMAPLNLADCVEKATDGDLSAEAKYVTELVQLMLTMSPYSRPSAKELLALYSIYIRN